jgi:hypothetical protein
LTKNPSVGSVTVGLTPTVVGATKTNGVEVGAGAAGAFKVGDDTKTVSAPRKINVGNDAVTVGVPRTSTVGEIVGMPRTIGVSTGQALIGTEIGYF